LTNAKPTEDQESSFRKLLEDVADFIDRMKPHCQSIEELALLARQGAENDATLRLLLKEVTAPMPNLNRR